MIQDEYDFLHNLLDIIDNYDHNDYIYILDEIKTISSNINFNNELTENNNFCLADTLYSRDGNYFFEFTEEGHFVRLEPYVPKDNLRDFFRVDIYKTKAETKKIITQQPLFLIKATTSNLENKFSGFLKKEPFKPIEYAKLTVFVLIMIFVINQIKFAPKKEEE